MYPERSTAHHSSQYTPYIKPTPPSPLKQVDKWSKLPIQQIGTSLHGLNIGYVL